MEEASVIHLGHGEVQQAIVERIEKIQPSSRARWGKMTAAGMLCHLNDSLLLPLGEKAAAPIPGIFPRTAMKWGALYLPIRWPRGAPSAPEWIQGLGGTPPGNFEADRARLIDSLARFRDPDLPLGEPRHPLFGCMSRTEWMRWGYLHIDHHLHQFGL